MGRGRHAYVHGKEEGPAREHDRSFTRAGHRVTGALGRSVAKLGRPIFKQDWAGRPWPDLGPPKHRCVAPHEDTLDAPPWLRRKLSQHWRTRHVHRPSSSSIAIDASRGPPETETETEAPTAQFDRSRSTQLPKRKATPRPLHLNPIAFHSDHNLPRRATHQSTITARDLARRLPPSSTPRAEPPKLPRPWPATRRHLPAPATPTTVRLRLPATAPRRRRRTAPRHRRQPPPPRPRPRPTAARSRRRHHHQGTAATRSRRWCPRGSRLGPTPTWWRASWPPTATAAA